MKTKKQRINISVSTYEMRVISNLARKDNMPKATKARELILKAIEIEEDLELERIAKIRDAENAMRISHKKMWAHLK